MTNALLAPLIVGLLAGRLSNRVADYFLANGNPSTSGNCPNCKKSLSVLAKLPILGALTPCRGCNTRRPVQATVEFFCLTWTMVAYAISPSQWLGVAFLSTVALVLFRTDWEDMVLYDAAQLALFLGALLFRGPRMGLTATFEIILWALGAGFSVWCFGKCYKTIKGYSGIGEGDPLLVATLSLWLSPLFIPILLSSAPLAAAAWGMVTKREVVPLGAFLSLFAPIVMLLESQI